MQANESINTDARSLAASGRFSPGAGWGVRMRVFEVLSSPLILLRFWRCGLRCLPSQACISCRAGESARRLAERSRRVAAQAVKLWDPTPL